MLLRLRWRVRRLLHMLVLMLVWKLMVLGRLLLCLRNS